METLGLYLQLFSSYLPMTVSPEGLRSLGVARRAGGIAAVPAAQRMQADAHAAAAPWMTWRSMDQWIIV